MTEHSSEVGSIMRSLYVDDYAGGGSDTNHAYEIYKSMKTILQLGGFDVHKFVTNDIELKQRVSPTEATASPCESYADRTLGNRSKKTKVLCIPWCNNSDQLEIEFAHVLEPADGSSKPTKRSL